MEDLINITGIRNDQFRRDLAAEIGIDEIEQLPMELYLYVPPIDTFVIPDNSAKKEISNK